MDDIIEIYEPVYRESNNLLLLLIIVLAAIVLLIITILVIKRIKNQKSKITPEQQYQHVLGSYIKLQKKIDMLSSHDFSNYASNIFKSYLSDLYLKDYISLTAQEMLINMYQESGEKNESLEEIFIHKLEPAQFGKLELNSSTKNIIVKECVDYITVIYNKSGGEND